MNQDSIYALASGAGRAGVAVIRISGPGAGGAITALTGGACPEPRRAALRRLCDPRDGDAMDRALVLWFPGPHSFTGEDMAEFQVHGGRAVTAGVLEALGAIKGLRPAEPGEFARRAFAHGKLDLTEAEALADLVAAETAAQRRQALRQMDGALSRLYEQWREKLVGIMGHWEAMIDFPEEDLPANVVERAKRSVSSLIQEMDAHLGDDRRGERLRDGFHLAIVGEPNVGKSSLLNALARRQAAIVSEEAGTTRDIVEVHLDIKGFPVILADTAGLREALGAVEREGVRRALDRAEQADLKLVVLDGGGESGISPSLRALIDQDALLVANKMDLKREAPNDPIGPHPELVEGETRGLVLRKAQDEGVRTQDIVSVSAKTGEGLEILLDHIAERIARRWGRAEAHPSLTRERHRLAVNEARDALVRTLRAPLPELAAEDLRLAARALGRITGRVEVEEVLDVVFRDFCIGK